MRRLVYVRQRTEAAAELALVFFPQFNPAVGKLRLRFREPHVNLACTAKWRVCIQHLVRRDHLVFVQERRAHYRDSPVVFSSQRWMGLLCFIPILDNDALGPPKRSCAERRSIAQTQ